MIEQKAQFISFFEYILQISKLSPADYKDALTSLLKDSESQINWLIDRKLYSSEEANALHADYSSWPQVSLNELSMPDIKLPEQLAREFHALIFSKDDGSIKIAITNPNKANAKNHIGLYLGLPISFYLCSEHEIKSALERLYRDKDKAKLLIGEAVKLSEASAFKSLNQTEIITLDSGSKTTSLMNSILNDAINLKASDIHIESGIKKIIIRYRLSGSLVTQLEIPSELSNVLLRHIVARADGDLLESRLPQDCSFRHMHMKQLINIRVSILYSVNGYSIVMRLLQPAEEYQDLKRIVSDSKTYEALSSFLEALNGMMLITGPTSSGKTTLLYTALMRIVEGNRKILTAEDPVEVQLPGITQVQVIPEINLDYAEVIKTSLRQNPDALMLGEIRDSESANMAMRAAITGVMVAATLHTKNVTGTVLRLIDLGVELSMIATGVGLIVAARLIRKICKSCCKESVVNDEHIQRLSKLVDISELKGKKIYEAVGCAECMQTGYSGLNGVYEFLMFTSELTRSLAEGDFDAFRKGVMEEMKGRTLGDNAINLWVQGITSFEEVTKLVFH